MIDKSSVNLTDGIMLERSLNRYQQQALNLRDDDLQRGEKSDFFAIQTSNIAPSPRTPIQIYQHSVGSSASVIKKITEENQIAASSDFNILIK